MPKFPPPPRNAQNKSAFSASLADLKRGSRMTFLGGQAAVERVDPAMRLTGPPGEGDFPAAAKAADDEAPRL